MFGAVMRILYLKDSKPKEALDEMKRFVGSPRHITLSNTGIVTSSAVVHQWKLSRFLDTHCPPFIMPPSSRL